MYALKTEIEYVRTEYTFQIECAVSVLITRNISEQFIMVSGK